MRGTLRTVLVIVILLIIAGGAYAIFHDNNKNDNNSNQTSSQPANNTSSNTSQDQQSSSTTPAAIIQTKTDPTAGQYLADKDGKTLYTYGADTSGVSNCTGACLASWPAYVAAASSTNLPANVTIITRSDNHQSQYAYKGLPLYYYVGDSSAGQVTGDNVNNFKVAKP
jgi:predicted lipoprotein with Yx(FWY)xxD motif